MLTRPTPVRGLYDDPFWEFVQNEDLRLQRCDDCAAFRFPPAPVCPTCLSPAFTWTPLSGRGTVLAWTVFHQKYFPDLPVPYTVIAVQTDEGPIVMGNPVGGVDHRVAIGDRVRVTYEQVAGESGPWKIHQWEPDKEQQ